METEKKYKVYVHIFPNSKRYVGVTCQTTQKRWRYGKGYSHNKYMVNAIEKYGWENVRHEILYENLTKEQAEQKEIELISEYKSNQREFGYNIENGGNLLKVSEETKKLISLNNGRGNLGKHLSEETKRKISISKKGQMPSNPFKKGNKPWNLGQTYSDEYRQKLSISHSGEKNIWYGKHLPKEMCDKISTAKKGIRTGNAIHNMKRIEMFDLEGNFIKEYDCMMDVEKELGIKYQNISMCCRGIIKQTHNHIFKYKSI